MSGAGAPPAKVSFALWGVVILATQTSVLFGWGLAQLNAVTGDASLKGSLQRDVPGFDAASVTIATSLTVMAAFLAASVGDGWIAAWGARRVLLANNALFLLGGLLTALPDRLAIFAGRFILGGGVGIGACAVPPFLTEIAPPEHRGRIGSLHQLMVTVGALVAAILGYIFCSFVDHGWIYANALFVVPAVLQWSFRAQLPDSPRWLVCHGRTSEAEAVLRLFQEPDAAAEAVRGMVVEHAESVRSNISLAWSRSSGALDLEARSQGPSAFVRFGARAHGYEAVPSTDQREVAADDAAATWTAVFAMGRPAVIGFGLASLQSLTGVNIVVGFSTMLFRAAGLAQPVLGTLAVSAANVAVTAVAGGLLDLLGRRVLLLVSCGVMAASMLVASGAILFIKDTALENALSIIGLVAYIFGFGLGVGPVTWVLVTEVVPTELRSKASSGFAAANWLCNCFVVGLTQIAINSLGGCAFDAPDFGDDDGDCGEANQMRGVGFLFGVVALVCIFEAIFVLTLVPETRNMSLEDLQRMFRKRKRSSASSRSFGSGRSSEARYLLDEQGAAAY